MNEYKPETGEREMEVIKLARERRESCHAAEATTREEAQEDVRFARGDQWPKSIRTFREHDPSGSRPCLTVNKTGQYVRQVVNDGRQNRPAIHVFPIGGGSDKDTADIMNGMIRDTEQRTDADICYDTALECAARSGEGYFRLVSRYTDPEDGFEQELAFQRIRNFANVHMDPAAIDPAGADAQYAFIDQWMSDAEFDEKYGQMARAGLTTQGLGQHAPQWLQKGQVLVADYYSIEEGQKRTLALLKSGAQVIVEEQGEDVNPEDIVAQRTIRTSRCVIRKITGTRVLEKTVFPCHYIPVFRVVGEEFEIDGEVIYQGLIRPMKDSQRMYNYWISTATEKGALEAKAPYIGAEGQFEGHEREWQSANRIPHAYLEYKPVDIDGNLAPPPQRASTSFAGAADVQMAELSSTDMQSTTGIYEAGLGASSNEKSGRAIIARQREADTGTFHYVDNLARAIRHCGRVMVLVLPKYHNNEAVRRIIGEDGSEDVVRINQREEKDGNIERVNDITIGRYDVTVEVGPSYTTRRLEAADSMIAFVQAVPMAGQAIMDLLAKSMDWPGAEAIAERLRRMVPPNLLAEEEEGALTPEMVNGMINQVVQQMQQQFEASMEQQKVNIDQYEAQVKQYEAETERIDSALTHLPDRDQIREIVAESLAEFLQQMNEVA